MILICWILQVLYITFLPMSFWTYDLLKDTYERSIQSSKGILGLQAKFTLRDDAKPMFIKARPFPFKLRLLIEKEINSLVELGIFVKLTTSEWAASSRIKKR